jgi:hypothetical protein
MDTTKVVITKDELSDFYFFFKKRTFGIKNLKHIEHVHSCMATTTWPSYNGL